MTVLNKPLRRSTQSSYRVLFQKPRQIIVLLLPGDILGFKEKGRRSIFHLPIETAFRIAVREKARATAAEKKTAKKGKK